MQHPRVGGKVRTVDQLGDTRGMLVHERYLAARVPYTLGTLQGRVPDHGGDVWYVEHESGTTAVYAVEGELEWAS